MRYIYSLFIGMISALTTSWALVLFKLMGVNCGHNFLCQGLLRLKSRGDFTLGSGVTINSSYGSSPIGSNVFTSIIINSSAKLLIGDNTGLSNTYIYCREEISIGSSVLIGGGCQIYDTDFHSLNHEKRMLSDDRGASKKVCIEDNVFIGANSIILKGSFISNNSVIGAGSVVRGYIPPNEIWCGNPAKFVRGL